MTKNRNKTVRGPLVFLALFLLVVGTLFAADPQVSSVTDATANYKDGYRITTITWVADSTGTVTTTTSTENIRGIIDRIITIPDTSLVPAVEDSSGRAPSSNYDITLTTVNPLLTNMTGGIEVAGNALANRDHSQIEQTIPRYITPGISGDQDTLAVPIFIHSKLSTAVSGNTIPNARGRILLFWQEK